MKDIIYIYYKTILCFSVEGKKYSTLLPVRRRQSSTFSQTAMDCRHMLVKFSVKNPPDVSVFDCWHIVVKWEQTSLAYIYLKVLITTNHYQLPPRPLRQGFNRTTSINSHNFTWTAVNVTNAYSSQFGCRQT